MFCPECGQKLPETDVRFCPLCGSRVPVFPEAVEPEPCDTETPELDDTETPELGDTETQTAADAKPTEAAQDDATPSKLSTAALLLGTGACLFGMLTVICRILNTNLRVFGAVSVTTFFLAPPACLFGLAGILVRIKNTKSRGLFRAIFGLCLGLIFGVIAAYCLYKRILYY